MSKPPVIAKPSCADMVELGTLSVAEARARIGQMITPIEAFETVPIRAALGRILAKAVCAGIDVPSDRNAAMDGYAFAAPLGPVSGDIELDVVGTVLAGSTMDTPVAAKQCVRIMTGAVLPAGTDSVVIQERVERTGDRIRFSADLACGDNVRNAGEDIKAGAQVFSPGVQLTAADLGVLASVGIAELAVVRRIKVAFFSTGDELRSLGKSLKVGQIYDSNRYTLHGMLQRLEVEIIDMGIVRDDPVLLEIALREAAGQADVVISSGGVSVGEADFVKGILTNLGQIDFWKIAMKPGRPLTFGRLQQAYFFGLPGNPVSVMVTFYQFVQPALRKLMGVREGQPLLLPARCLSALKKRPGRTEFQRGILQTDEAGQLVVEKTGAQGSGILSSMVRANCFIVLMEDCAGVAKGDWVSVQPFAGMI